MFGSRAVAKQISANLCENHPDKEYSLQACMNWGTIEQGDSNFELAEDLYKYSCKEGLRVSCINLAALRSEMVASGDDGHSSILDVRSTISELQANALHHQKKFDPRIFTTNPFLSGFRLGLALTDETVQQCCPDCRVDDTAYRYMAYRREAGILDYWILDEQGRMEHFATIIGCEKAARRIVLGETVSKPIRQRLKLGHLGQKIEQHRKVSEVFLDIHYAMEAFLLDFGRYPPVLQTTSAPGTEPCPSSCDRSSLENCDRFSCIGFKPTNHTNHRYACQSLTDDREVSNYTCVAVVDLDGVSNVFVYGTNMLGGGTIVAPIPSIVPTGDCTAGKTKSGEVVHCNVDL